MSDLTEMIAPIGTDEAVVGFTLAGLRYLADQNMAFTIPEAAQGLMLSHGFRKVMIHQGAGPQ